jgi:manganese-dependent ADP-ribose/CDP-alcohol diphosphatase
VLTAAGALALTASIAVAADRPLLRIGAIADCQYADQPDNGARMYRRSPAKLAAAVAHFNRLSLDHVVHLGDFIDRDWASFDALQPSIDALRHRWRFVLGNHDFAVDDDHKPLVAGRLGMPARYYSFEAKGWVFLALDGNDLSEYGWPAGSPELAASQAAHRTLYPSAPDWDGGVGDAQLRWIDDTLTAADRRGQRAILYCHFPVYPDNPHNLWNTPAVMALIDRHRSVKAWINGHNHDGNFGARDGVHYVNLKGMLDTPDTAYAVIDLHADRIQINGFGRQPSLTLPLRG